MPPELAFKISIPYGDLAGRENWSTALSIARLSDHRNFTEQIGMPNANLRQAKAATKVTACLHQKIYVLKLTTSRPKIFSMSRTRPSCGSIARALFATIRIRLPSGFTKVR